MVEDVEQKTELPPIGEAVGGLAWSGPRTVADEPDGVGEPLEQFRPAVAADFGEKSPAGAEEAAGGCVASKAGVCRK